MLNNILIVYIVGCCLSWMIFKFCDLMGKSENKLSTGTMLMGVLASWIVVGYAIHLTIRTISEKKRKKSFISKLSDKEMVKQTIDDYWVKVIQDVGFDPTPSLPLKDSLLCNKYFFLTGPTGPTTKPRLCKNCPICKAGFGCNVTGFYLHYQKSGIGAQRQEAAITTAKVFQSVYEKLR